MCSPLQVYPKHAFEGVVCSTLHLAAKLWATPLRRLVRSCDDGEADVGSQLDVPVSPILSNPVVEIGSSHPRACVASEANGVIEAPVAAPMQFP
jgi:hypothetical protein